MTLYIAECGIGVTSRSCILQPEPYLLHSSHIESLSFIQGTSRPSMIPTSPLLALALSHVAQAWPTNYDAPQTPISVQGHTQGYEFDPLLHLPGISPYGTLHAFRSLASTDTLFQVLRCRRIWPKSRSTSPLQDHCRILPRTPCLNLRQRRRIRGVHQAAAFQD